jgi:hypothetical protein
MNYFLAKNMSMTDAERLYLLMKTFDKLGLASEKSKAIVFGIYLSTESNWANIRQETDYDDLH